MIGRMIGENSIIYKKEKVVSDYDKADSHQHYIDIALISGADRNHFGTWLSKLSLWALAWNYWAHSPYNLKRGLKEFGTAGLEAVQREMQQLHDRDVLITMHSSELSDQQHKQILTYLKF